MADPDTETPPQIEHLEQLIQNKSYQQRNRRTTADDAAEDNAPEQAGTYVPKKFKTPQPQNGGMNKEMAEAAAIQFKKKEKQIRSACQRLDNPNASPEPAAAGCCIIL